MSTTRRSRFFKRANTALCAALLLGMSTSPVLAMPTDTADVAGKKPLRIAAKSRPSRVTVVKKSAPSSSGRPRWSANIKVPYRAWLPEINPQEVLLCVHGLGFSSNSFVQFGRIMARRGFAVYAIDVRGFGEWMNRKEDQVDFEACLADLETALRALRQAYGKTPIFVAGESMGGAIALNAAARYPQLVDGLISSVPSSDRYAKLSSTIIVGSHYLTNKDKPIDIAPEVVNRATSDEALREKWEAEPTNRMKLTPRELKRFNDFMKGNNDAAALIEKLPVLMLAGFKDKLVKPEGTIELFNSLSTQQKLLMVVGDGEHLLLEENQLTPELSQLLFDWIKSASRQKHLSS